MELIKDYDLRLHYHPGKANVVADALSRKSHVSTLMTEEFVGERSNLKKIPTYTQDHGDGIATRGESVVYVPS